MLNYGYKWVANKLSDVFIVKLQLNNSFVGPAPMEYYTTDCVVDDIYRLRDGKHFPRVLNGAIVFYNYSVGQRITDDKIFYCKDIRELLICQYYAIQSKIKRHERIIDYIKTYNNPRLSSEQKQNVLDAINKQIFYSGQLQYKKQ